MRHSASGYVRPLLITAALILTAGVVSGWLSGGLNALLGGVFAWTASLTRAVPSEDALLSENERLLEENARLKSELADYADRKAENEQLWSLFGMTKKLPSLTLKPAAVLRRDAGDDYAAFTLGVGTDDGVSVGDPVVTAQGLVGRVARADSVSCKVVTVLSPEIRVSVTEKNTGDSGVLSGSAALCDAGLTEVTLLEENHPIRQDEYWYTSGSGGMYPPNLYVGRVAEVRQDSVTVEPCVDCLAIEYAAVVTDFAGKGEIKRDK